MKKLLSVSILSLCMAALLAGPASASTLNDVKAKGFLKCGVAPDNPGFSAVDSKGLRLGFGVDFTTAVATAVGVEPKFVPLTSKERLPALQSGEIDLLFKTTTMTMSRDTRLGLDFAAIILYDGQGIMVRKELGIKSAKELDGASICLATGSTTELNISDYFRQNGMKFKPVVFEKQADVRKAYDANRCDCHTTDVSGLAAQRSLMTNPAEHMILPEMISKEPLGLVTRHGDNQWTDIARWVVNLTVTADEKGITQANVAEIAKTSKDPEVQRMLGVTGTLWTDLGLDKDAPIRVLQKVGNYNEIFNRNLGPDTPLGMPRGLNNLWNNGGILYAPPFR
ncbi:amino acid ABC transporter substrate-binding protein [Desulfoluna sp.]|uniref:amino acid ABC transporter substrate-binding protein n=1 Tax=Desulfoluna sp. TaxID=2045199 RepID=UPI002638E854|nr:amino acid ABC transporter substrate-binding protein [Desulfoluna sp.]